MAQKKERSELSTWEKIWPSLIIGWFIMYFLGLVVFPIKYPNTDINGQEYQSFMWLWLKLYLSLFTLGYMLGKDLIKDK